MALTFGDNISYQGKKPLDSRSIFKTIADMKAYSENYLPPLAMCQNEEDGKIYTYDVNNEVNETLGKWRVLEGSGSGTSIIEDTATTETDKTWSANKITEYVNAQIGGALNGSY